MLIQTAGAYIMHESQTLSSHVLHVARFLDRSMQTRAQSLVNTMYAKTLTLLKKWLK